MEEVLHRPAGSERGGGKRLTDRTAWDAKWSALSEKQRRDLLLLKRAGIKTVGNLVNAKPEVPSYLADIYDRFYLLDRDGMSGRVTVGSMREILDELEIRDRAVRLRIIQLWRAMDTEFHRKDDEGEE